MALRRTIFALRALTLATEGVAMLVRTQWIEGAGRYASLFRDQPPTIYAPFVERVPMIKGRWDPNASTATAYAWFVWCRYAAGPTLVVWIPPGCRANLSHPGDRERFAAWSLERTAAPLLD
jgi:hypothetical protein